jgi:hypothetical protein
VKRIYTAQLCAGPQYLVVLAAELDEKGVVVVPRRTVTMLQASQQVGPPYALGVPLLEYGPCESIGEAERWLESKLEGALPLHLVGTLSQAFVPDRFRRVAREHENEMLRHAAEGGVKTHRMAIDEGWPS